MILAMFLYVKSLGLVWSLRPRSEVGRNGEFLSEPRGGGAGLPGRGGPGLDEVLGAKA